MRKLPTHIRDVEGSFRESNYKYFDYKRNIPIRSLEDGCSISRWKDLHGEYSFGVHPNGFMVFLPPDKIDLSDEYKTGDPYSVRQNIGSEFQQRRISSTLALIDQCFGGNSKGLEILDVGCGEGHVTTAIAEKFGGSNVTGLDYSLSAIDHANKHYSDVDFSVGDARCLPYRKDFFDVVVCNNLWEHVPDPLRLLEEISKVTKKGGYLVVSTPSRYRIRNLMRVLTGKPIQRMSKHHVTEYSVGQMHELLAYGNYDIIGHSTKKIKMKTILRQTINRLLQIYIAFVGSHHILEATVFYIAKKR